MQLNPHIKCPRGNNLQCARGLSATGRHKNWVVSVQEDWNPIHLKQVQGPCAGSFTVRTQGLGLGVWGVGRNVGP